MAEALLALHASKYRQKKENCDVCHIAIVCCGRFTKLSHVSNAEDSVMSKLIVFLAALGFLYWPAWGLALVLMMVYVLDAKASELPASYQELLPDSRALVFFTAMVVMGFFFWQGWLIALLMGMHYVLNIEQSEADNAALKSMKTVDSMGVDDLRRAMSTKM